MATTPARSSETPALGVAFVTKVAPTVALRQVTLTPSPTATVTPTATPIVYHIEAGDTLLAIAITWGTTVAEIEALNPGIRPNLLQIGQAIILPPQQFFSVEGAAPTSVPLQIEINRVAMYRTPLGGAWLLGEVSNEGDLAAENLQVALTLPDEMGQPVATAAAWVYPTLLQPGERGGFAVLLNELAESIGVPEASIVAGSSAAQLGDRYLDIQIAELTADFTGADASLSGQLRNVGEAPAHAIRLTILLYDVEGQVTGLVQWHHEAILAAGESLPFTILVAPPGGPPADYYVVVEALREE